MKSRSARVPQLLAIFMALACALALLLPKPAHAAEPQVPLPSLHAISPRPSQPSLARALSVQAEGTWVLEPGDRWWFWYASGGWAANSWEWIGNAWYWFDADGWMQRGWQEVYGNWFHLNQSGAMDTGWLNDGGTWYFLGQDGWMRRDWTCDNGTWYYLRPSGAMATGWVESAGATYYLADTGVMQTGWVWTNNSWYFFHNDGSMARSETMSDGAVVGADGRWVPTSPTTPTTSDTPQSPSEPSTPESAQTPASPETPLSPLSPESPLSPLTPATPETATTPDTADTPVNPTTPETALTPESPVLPVVPAHTVTTHDAKLLYSRDYPVPSPSDTNSDGTHKVDINGQKMYFTQEELENWGDEIVITYTGQAPNLSLVYIPGHDDSLHEVLDVQCDGVWANLKGNTYSWYGYMRVNPDSATSKEGEAHFPVAKLKEKWEAMLQSKRAAGTPLTWTDLDGVTRDVTIYTTVMPSWYVSKATGATSAPTTLHSIEVRGGTQTRNVPATLPLQTRDQIMRALRGGINVTNTFQAVEYSDSPTYLDPFWGNTQREYHTGPAFGSALQTYADINAEVLWHNHRATPEEYEGMVKAGITAIRMPVSWGQHIKIENGQYVLDPTFLQSLHYAVDCAYDAGLYIILNTHNEYFWLERADLDTAYEQIKPVFTWLWHTIAEEFKDYDQRLIFEGMNEPRASGYMVPHAREWSWTTPGDAATLNKLNQDLVDTVRAASGPYNKVRLCTVQARGASSRPQSLATLVVPDDPYVAIAIHLYTPGSWFNPSGTPDLSSDAAIASAKLAIDESFTSVLIAKNDERYGLKGIPMYIGEYGLTDYQGNSAAREEVVRYYNTWAKQVGIPTFYWTGTKIYDRRTYTWRAPGTFMSQGTEGPVIVGVWDDPSIVFGSRANEYDPLFTRDINEGTKLPFRYESGQQGTGCTETFATFNRNDGTQPRVKFKDVVDIAGKTLAMHFTGYYPNLCLYSLSRDGKWKGNVEVAPSNVVPDGKDCSGYTAYWLPEKIEEAWYKATHGGNAKLQEGDTIDWAIMKTYAPVEPYGPTTMNQLIVLD